MPGSVTGCLPTRRRIASSDVALPEAGDVARGSARQRHPILPPLRAALRSLTTRRSTLPPPPYFSEAELRAWAPAEDGLLPPHLRLGVSLGYLRAFCETANIRPWDATHKVADVIIRKTAKSRRSYAEDLLDSDTRTSDDLPAVAAATLFVIHSHECSWTHMLDAVEDRLLAAGADLAVAYLWLDVCCVRRHRVREDVVQVGRAQRAIGAACVVLDPPSAPACLSRQWVLFEIAQAALADGVSLGLAFGPPAPPNTSRSAPPQLDEEPTTDLHILRKLDVVATFDKPAFVAQLRARVAGCAREASAGVDKERDAIVARVKGAFGGELAGDERAAFGRYGELVCFALERAYPHATFASRRHLGRPEPARNSSRAIATTAHHAMPSSTHVSARSLSIGESSLGACQVGAPDDRSLSTKK
jgi:hypothetical protein